MFPKASVNPGFVQAVPFSGPIVTGFKVHGVPSDVVVKVATKEFPASWQGGIGVVPGLLAQMATDAPARGCPKPLTTTGAVIPTWPKAEMHRSTQMHAISTGFTLYRTF
jgi:hypothetical protein